MQMPIKQTEFLTHFDILNRIILFQNQIIIIFQYLFLCNITMYSLQFAQFYLINTSCNNKVNKQKMKDSVRSRLDSSEEAKSNKSSNKYNKKPSQIIEDQQRRLISNFSNSKKANQNNLQTKSIQSTSQLVSKISSVINKNPLKVQNLQINGDLKVKANSSEVQSKKFFNVSVKESSQLLLNQQKVIKKEVDEIKEIRSKISQATAKKSSQKLSYNSQKNKETQLNKQSKKKQELTKDKQQISQSKRKRKSLKIFQKINQPQKQKDKTLQRSPKLSQEHLKDVIKSQIGAQEQDKQQIQKQQAMCRLSRLQQISQLIRSKKSTILLDSLIKNVSQDIVFARITVRQQPQALNNFIAKKRKEVSQLGPLNQSRTNQLLQKQYSLLIQKKATMIEQLRQMQNLQFLIKKNSINSSLISSPNHKYNKMPQLTQQDRKHWLKIRQFVKDHEQNSKIMCQINYKRLAQQRQEHLQQEQKRKKQLSIQKRKTIENKIHKIQTRSKQRTQHIEGSRVVLDKLKNKTKLFQKMEQSWFKLKQKLEMQDQANKMQIHTAKRIVNLRQIKQYEKSHNQRFQQQTGRRKKRFSQSKSSLQNRSYQKNCFSIDVIQESKIYKQKQIQKIQQIKQMMQKKKQYATLLKQKLKIKSKCETKNEKPELYTKLRDSVSISAFDIRSKGNQYMHTIHQSVVRLRGKNSAKQKSRAQTSQKPRRYKNYLEEILQKRQSNTKQSSLKRNIDMINTIMKKSDVSAEQKFFQARIITEKIQSGGTQKHLLKSINAKMQILKKLSYNE